MDWKDYETLDVTREIATEQELEKLREQYKLDLENKSPFKPINKGGRSDIFKKKYL